MSLNDVCAISSLLSEEDRYEEEQRQQLLDKQQALKSAQDRMDKEETQAKHLSSVFEGLLVKAADEKNMLKGKSLIISTLKDDCEQHSHGIEAQKSEEQATKRARKQEILLEDLEATEQQMDWLDSWWKEYQELSEADYATQAERIEADVKVYEAEIDELQSSASQVLLLSKEVREHIEANKMEQEKQENYLREQFQKKTALEQAIQEEMRCLAEEPDLAQRQARDRATADLLASNAIKRQELQEQRQREALAEQQLSQANADMQAALSDKASLETENKALLQLQAEEAVPVERLQQELEATKQQADLLNSDADRAARDAHSYHCRQEALNDSLLAFDESSSTIIATVNKIQESTDELQAEISEIRDQLSSSPKRKAPPELAEALAYSRERAQELQAIKTAQEDKARQVDEATQNIQSLAEAITHTERQIHKELSAAAELQTSLQTLSSEDALREDFAGSEAEAGVSAALSVPLDEELQAVDREVQERARALEVQMQELLHTESKAEAVLAELQEALTAHQVQLDRLEDERVSSQFEAQTKKALAEHRRENIQKQKRRKAALVLQVNRADADFRADWALLEEELSSLETALAAECAGLYDLRGHSTDTGAATTAMRAQSKAGLASVSVSASASASASASVAKSKAKSTSNTRKKNRRQAKASRSATAAATAASAKASPPSSSTTSHSVYDFDPSATAKTEPLAAPRRLAKAGGAKKESSGAHITPTQQRKAPSLAQVQLRKPQPLQQESSDWGRDAEEGGSLGARRKKTTSGKPRSGGAENVQNISQSQLSSAGKKRR